MSGGSFDYTYLKAFEFAEELERKLSLHPDLYCAATNNRLKRIQTKIMAAGRLMKEVEYLYSGDSGEDTFLDATDDDVTADWT